MGSKLVLALIATAPVLVVEACGGHEASIPPSSDAGEGGGSEAAAQDSAVDGRDGTITTDSDAGVVDAGNDRKEASVSEASDDGGSTGWHDVTNNAFWSTFNTTTVSQYAGSFVGGAFDGRYVYLAPDANQPGAPSVAVRYDTTAPFAVASSWQTFDTTAFLGQTVAFNGAVFDGRFVYLVPNTANTNALPALRFDTTATAFGSAASWSSFDLTGAAPNLDLCAGGTFDGRYLYLSCSAAGADGGPTIRGIVARHDTQGTFANASSWSSFDLTGPDPGAAAFIGAVYDGNAIDFAPAVALSPDGGYGVTGVSASYDKHGPFTAGSAWSTFDTTALAAAAKGFFGGAFDGRYVYLVPEANGSPPVQHESGSVARHDTTSTFDAGGVVERVRHHNSQHEREGLLGGRLGRSVRVLHPALDDHAGPVPRRAPLDLRPPGGCSTRQPWLLRPSSLRAPSSTGGSSISCLRVGTACCFVSMPVSGGHAARIFGSFF